jgi:NADH-quinone oxidoreductase subunit H
MVDVAAAFTRAVLVVFGALLALPFVAWLEGLRGRAGASVAGPRGARTALATALKLLEKRAPSSAGRDRFLHDIAPMLALVPTVAVPGLLPATPDDPLGVTLPVLLAFLLLATVATALAGFAGDNRLALLGTLRIVLLRVGVIVVIATAALGPAVLAGSSVVAQIVVREAVPLVGVLPSWGVFVSPLGALAACVALAIHAQGTSRARAEATLGEPWLAEASGPVLLGHRVFETLDLLAGAAVIAVVFLGGWHVPGLVEQGAHPAIAALASSCKTAIALAIVLGVRGLLPPLPWAVAVRLCWMVLLPLAGVGALLVIVVRGLF